MGKRRLGKGKFKPSSSGRMNSKLLTYIVQQNSFSQLGAGHQGSTTMPQLPAIQTLPANPDRVVIAAGFTTSQPTNGPVLL